MYFIYYGKSSFIVTTLVTVALFLQNKNKSFEQLFVKDPISIRMNYAFKVKKSIYLHFLWR